MKTLLSRIAWRGLATGLVLLGSFVLFVRFAGKDEAIASPLRMIDVRPLDLPAAGGVPPSLPDEAGEEPLPVERLQTVDFLANPDDLGGDPAQREERLRDWLMRVAIARSGLPHAQAVRLDHDFVAGTGEGVHERPSGFGPGPVRWIEAALGEALVLLPEGGGDARRKELARIADEIAWRNHRLPRRLVVFEYWLGPTTLLATLIRRQPIEEKTLFSGEYGYREGFITHPAALHDLLRTVDDVVAIRAPAWSDVGLQVGGRRLPDRKPHGMTPSQVLVAWAAFAEANEQARRFRQRAREEVADFNAWSSESRRKYNENWQSANDLNREIWFSGEDVDDVAEQQEQATEEAKELNDSSGSLQSRLAESLNQRKSETEAAVRRAWADVPDAIRSAWNKVVLDR